MPRDGSGIYSIPPGTQGSPNTTIESAKYNAYIADVEADLNAPRPIIAGGTGSNSAAGARAAIAAERATQAVTNYDSVVWEAGSFFSAIGATGAPNAIHAFAGVVYGPDANNMVIEARDQTDGVKYVRRKTAGVWGAWSTDASDKVAKAGDTMTGDLKIQKASPALTFDATDANPASIWMTRTASVRWKMDWGLGAEAGANAGADFALTRFNDAGVVIDTPLSINRATGRMTINGDPTAALGVATKQYADATPNNRVLKAGDTMTGTLTMAAGAATGISFFVGPTETPIINANRASGAAAGARWQVQLTSGAESGGNVGGSYVWAGFTDTGAYLGNPLTLNRKAPYLVALNAAISDTANATSSTTGAFQCAGGIGIGGNSWSAGEFCSSTLRVSTAPDNYKISRSGSNGWLEFMPNQLTFSGYTFYVINASGTAVGLAVSNAGTLRAGGYTAGTLVSDASGNISVSSDERMKNVVAPFTRGLDALRKIGGADIFSWKHEAETHPDQRYAGFVAQKVQRGIPEAVNVDHQGMLALDDRPIIATLMNAVLELEAKVAQLTGETQWRKT